MLNDGKPRTVEYSIIEDGGFAGFGPGVEWCVVGLDRNWAYNPACRAARPLSVADVALHRCGLHRGCPVVMITLLVRLCLLSVQILRSIGQGRRHVASFIDALSIVARFAGWRIVAIWLRWCSAVPASAQDHRQNAPGEFDFYVLSLSWSPSFCEAARERGRQRPLAADAVRRPAVLLRRAWPVAAIRARLSGLLPAAVAAARPQHHDLDARSDAGAGADLQRVGQARHLLGARSRAAISRPSARRARR